MSEATPPPRLGTKEYEIETVRTSTGVGSEAIEIPKPPYHVLDEHDRPIGHPDDGPIRPAPAADPSAIGVRVNLCKKCVDALREAGGAL
jgi:hypothetical protein